MLCPECGGAELVPGMHAVPYTYKGHSTSFRIQCEKCPQCGELILTKEQSEIYDGLMGQFEQAVDQQLYDPGFVLAVRKKLGMTQKQAGELFGGGPNAFSRYELGKVRPPQTLVQLFRLLNNDPSRLEELKFGSS